MARLIGAATRLDEPEIGLGAVGRDECGLSIRVGMAANMAGAR